MSVKNLFRDSADTITWWLFMQNCSYTVNVTWWFTGSRSLQHIVCFKGLRYRRNHHLVCNLSIYNRLYIYIHAHICKRDQACKTGLEEMFEEGKTDTAYNIITEIYLYSFCYRLLQFFSLGTEEMDKSCQNCTQSHHPHQISSLNFSTALICADDVLTMLFLGLLTIMEYIKMPSALFAFRSNSCLHQYKFIQW